MRWGTAAPNPAARREPLASAVIRRCSALIVVAAVLAIGCGETTGEASASKLPRSFFGVVTEGGAKAGEYERMGDGKVGTYRMLISWSRVQPVKGEPYNWDELDGIFVNLARVGIKPLPFLWGTPRWIADEINEAPIRKAKQRKGWKKFVSAAVARYGPKGKLWDQVALTEPQTKPSPARTWEVWNEINSPFFFGPKVSAKKYAKLLEITDEAISREDKRGKIIVGGMAGVPIIKGSRSAWDFLDDLYQVPGAKKHFDYVGVHPYGRNTDAISTHMSRTRKVMKRNGDRRAGTWITEMGWGSDKANSNSTWVKTPAGQAKMLKKSIDLMAKKRKSWNLKGMIWYSFSDPVEVSGHCSQRFCASSGLLTSDGESKPAWLTFTKSTGGQP
jgi:hypothetical protein